MHCETLETRIHELLDRGRGPADDAAIAAHIASCSECRELVAAYQAMLDGVDTLPTPEPRAGFLDGIRWPSATSFAAKENGPLRQKGGLFAGEGTAGRRPSVGWIAAAATLAVAASLLVMALLRSAPDGPDTPRSSPVASTAGGEDASVPFAPMQFPPEQVRAVCQTTGRSLVSLPAAVRRVTSETATADFTTHIRPFVEPVGAAWEAVRRRFPASSNSSPDPGADTGWIWANERLRIA